MKGRKYIILFFIFLSFSSFSKEFKGNYEEGYIEININKKINYTFFPIYMDYENTEPYVGVMNLFSLIMAKNMKIDREKKLIYGKLGEKEYKYDYSTTQYITGKTDIYIRGSDLSKLFSLKEYKWSTETYIVDIKTQFKTPYENFIEQQKRISELENKDKKDKVDDSDIYTPKKKLLTLGVLKPRYTNYNIEDSEGTFSVRYNTQLLYGDFATTGFIHPDPYLGYTTLRYNEILDGKSIIVGDSNMQTYNFLSSRRLVGISIQDWNGMGDIEVGETSIRGVAPFNSSVELYRNGTLYRFTRVDKDGTYEFNNINIQGYSDVYTIKIYNYDGSIEVKQVSMMSGSKILKKGKFDYSGIIGTYRKLNDDREIVDLDDKKVEGNVRVNYGITNNLTIGSEYINDFHTEDIGGIDYNLPVNMIGLNLYYTTGAVKFPTYFEISEIYDIENFFETSNRNTHIGKIRQRIFNNVLSLEGYLNSDFVGIIEKEKNRYQVDWRGSLSKYWGYNLTYDYYDIFTYNEQYGEVGLYRNKNNTSHDLSVEFPLKDTYDATKLHYMYSNGNINFFKTRYNFVLELNSTPKYYDVDSDMRVALKSSGNNKINGGIYGTYDVNNEYTVGLEVKYRATNWLEIIGTLVRRDKNTNHGIGVDIEKTIILDKAFTKNSNPSTSKSWLEGILFIDDNGNGVMDSGEKVLEGVEVKVGRKKCITDENGYYFIDNISAYKVNDLKIDSRTIDPMLEPANDKKYVKLYPATGGKVDIPIQPISVIMGSITILGEPVNGIEHFSIISQIYLQLKTLDGKLVKEQRIEPEGYFMLDKILPGKYHLIIDYRGDKKIEFKETEKEVTIKLDKYGSYYENYDFEVISVNGRTIDDLIKEREEEK